MLADVCALLQQPQDTSTASSSWGLRARVLTLFFPPGVPEPLACDPHLWLWAAPRLAAEDLVWSLPGPFLPSPAPGPMSHAAGISRNHTEHPGPSLGGTAGGVFSRKWMSPSQWANMAVTGDPVSRGGHMVRSWGATQCRPVPPPHTGTPKSYLTSFTSHRPPFGAG